MFRNLKSKIGILNLFIILVVFLLGIFIGSKYRPAVEKIVGVYNKELPVTIQTQTDFSPFWKAWSSIDQKYPDAKKTTDQQRVYGAIAGLVNSLNDPYSVFFPPEEAKSFEDDIAGSFTGIGAEIGIKEKILTIIAPLKGTPAYQAGLKTGDKILKIDNTITANLSIEEAVRLMRGEKGTTVVLTIFREEEEKSREVKIVRDVINVPSLETELRANGIFVITLSSFSANSADLFREALKKFAEAKTDKMILDLRGNPGGYLSAAVDMASWFLPNGKTVLIEDYGNNKKQKLYRSLGYDVFNENLKLVILIDGGSASASEILAGALQDYGLAKLVGERSYGKGSVQEVVNITSDTILKITIAKWLTPKGQSISEKGLTPDYPVIFTQKDLEAKKDPPMEKAVEILLKN